MSYNFSESIQSSDAVTDLMKTNVPFIICSLVICACGIVGNFIVISIIVILQEYRKTVTHWYMLQLAIADSLFLLAIPFNVSETIHHQWIFPEWLCKTKQTVLFLNYYASVMFLAIMSIDRYVAICHAFSTKIGILRTPRAAMFISAAAWGISLLFCTPIMLFAHTAGIDPHCTCTYQFPSSLPQDASAVCPLVTDQLEKCKRILTPAPGSSKFCHLGIQPSISTQNNVTNGVSQGGAVAPQCTYRSSPSGFRSLLIFNFAVMYVFPVMIMGICYGLIIRHVRVTSLALGNSRSPSAGKRRGKKGNVSMVTSRRVTIMCATLVFSFTVLWLPFHSTHLAKISGILESAQANLCVNLSLAGTILAYMNSVLNPVLYNFLSRGFCNRCRAACDVVKKAFGCNADGALSSGERRIASRAETNGRAGVNTPTTMSKIRRSRSDENLSGEIHSQGKQKTEDLRNSS